MNEKLRKYQIHDRFDPCLWKKVASTISPDFFLFRTMVTLEVSPVVTFFFYNLSTFCHRHSGNKTNVSEHESSSVLFCPVSDHTTHQLQIYRWSWGFWRACQFNYFFFFFESLPIIVRMKLFKVIFHKKNE